MTDPDQGSRENVRVQRPVDYRPLLDPAFRDPNLKPDAQAIQAFATANGWEYYIGSGPQPLPGVVFRDADGRSRFVQRAGNIVRMPGTPAIEVGNSAYSVTVNLNVMSITWGYAAVPLASPVPAMVVESAKAHALSPLPSLPQGTSPIPLGDADAALVAHVTPAAADWARNLFTPDICALLDDDEVPVNVEVAEGWLFLYSPRELSTADPAVWKRVFTLVEAVSTAIAARAAVSPAAHLAPPALPMQEKGWGVRRRRVINYYGAVIGVFLVLAAGIALFLPR